jgi:ribosomal protein S18 acetylase RimI-like enzyme
MLDNPAWFALTTKQAQVALGGVARRYPVDVTPIGAVERADARALDELADLTPVGDWISLPATVEGLGPLVPPRLRITMQKLLVQMVCERRIEAARPPGDVARLTESDIAQMDGLTAITHPGPWRSNTFTLGTYLGVRSDGRLVAMAGQRMHMPGHREISAVCTHPDFRGRGYARFLVAELVNAVLDGGETAFLHVEESNERAQAVYRGLGFSERRRLPLLVTERVA